MTSQRARSTTGSPVPLPITRSLERLHARFRDLDEGAVADYIPELAKAKPEWFGICVATTDGRVYEVGDTRQPFTIQSISKPLVYGLALEDRGRDQVLAKIGVEPTGDAFNSISLEPGTGRPLNPMINAGAIAAASLVAGRSDEDRFHRILSTFSIYAGRQLGIDQAVYESERDTGHRNRAIGHMLRNFDIVGTHPDGPLDVYFKQCSIAVDCHALSMMAATLANGGVNPVTGERAVKSDTVTDMLSVMTTCGMYDYAGSWVYWVGMPAKSGVGGGILAVLPGQLGIAVFSPPLDERGNSVRGVAVCKELSRDFQLHFLRTARVSRSAVRAAYDISAVRSKRVRTEAERRVLSEEGRRARVFELHGDLVFAGVESAAAQVVESCAELPIVDLTRVTAIDDAAARMLLDLVLALGESGKSLLLVQGREQSRFLRYLQENLVDDRRRWLQVFEELDGALERAEDQLLAARGAPASDAASISLADHELCRGLAADAVAHLARLAKHCRFAAGEMILRKGDRADAFYLLVAGKVSVTIDLPSGRRQRVSTLSAGMTFGELAILNDAPRSADVRADSSTECFALSIEDFRALGGTRPDIKLVVLENLLRNASQTAARLTQEIAALAR
ncbi:glutaminase A [Candidatus Binatia bacterium]|jgi:glutaminase|nr:glutaminase A [Candidatus Binatia bacterium]